MPQADEPSDDAQVNAVDEGEQLRIASQVGTKRMERAQALLGFADESRIVLKVEETGGIV